MKTGECKLCKETKDLCGSHLIPKFAYKQTNDSINKSVPVTVNDVFQAVQSGIKEDMLCKECELILSKNENILKSFLEDVQSGTGTNIVRHDELIEVSGHDFGAIKLAILSIIWRLSHTTRKEFVKASLGTYQEKWRKIIHGNIIQNQFQFAIMIDKLKFHGNLVDEIIMNFDVGKNTEKNYYIQSVCLHGTVFQVAMKEDIRECWGAEFMPLFMGTDKCVVMIKDMIEFFSTNKSIIKRYFDADVAEQMKKLKPKK
ncbi:MAG: hypothetical protein H6686_09100 [Fibrobacteria bacterium]|nr:hypothetical protein [Fibrobacteria bacterium]